MQWRTTDFPRCERPVTCALNFIWLYRYTGVKRSAGKKNVSNVFNPARSCQLIRNFLYCTSFERKCPIKRKGLKIYLILIYLFSQKCVWFIGYLYAAYLIRGWVPIMWHCHVVILELTTSTIPLPIQRETDEGGGGAKTVIESESSNKNGPWRELEALGEWKNNRKARR